MTLHSTAARGFPSWEFFWYCFIFGISFSRPRHRWHQAVSVCLCCFQTQHRELERDTISMARGKKTLGQATGCTKGAMMSRPAVHLMTPPAPHLCTEPLRIQAWALITSEEGRPKRLQILRNVQEEMFSHRDWKKKILRGICVRFCPRGHEVILWLGAEQQHLASELPVISVSEQRKHKEGPTLPWSNLWWSLRHCQGGKCCVALSLT